MDELKKINSKVARKQVRRLTGGIGLALLGVILIGKFTYQRGWTDCQKAISREFPDEYSAITEKVVKEFEKH